MNREEIENRIEVCELRAKGYREVGNTKLADKYENERYKWEKLLSDLNLLNERKIVELLDYKKGYFNLEQENKQLKENNQAMQEEMVRTWKKLDILNELRSWLEEQVESPKDFWSVMRINDILSKINELEKNRYEI